MEADEIREFTDQMKESGESGGAGVGVSLSISVLAVLVAMITVLGHRSHTQAVLFQSRASDQWNLYQAKKIRQQDVSLTSDLLSIVQVKDPKSAEEKLSEYKAHSAKWDDDLKEASDQAKEFAEETERAEQRADRYDLSEALLQIGVVLSSITLLTRRKSYWVTGMVLGIAGLFIAASVFWIH